MASKLGKTIGNVLVDPYLCKQLVWKRKFTQLIGMILHAN